ncbi:M1 family metallopeptidase [Imperialibacter roseus]|uniref:M1 family metallopeptidase n=1 Tax=Imperialibacter roseus TaxID=1324217 RepID=A0ABZ0IPQ3_9BACT|nr:M1 family metallopeptidase [Imperialibacter roseus]WOK06164.1 M1 family metallopeptidase [Imperialibacter roseus]
MKRILLSCLAIAAGIITAENVNAQGEWGQKFEQMGTMLPTPNTYRTASGAPGREYWQQKADYDISVTLNDNNQSVTGEETITYHNQSPDQLKYLWLQLDQNMRAKDSNTPLVSSSSMPDTISGKSLQQRITRDQDFDGGFKIASVKTVDGKAIPYTINKTMMRVDLPQPLKSGAEVSFKVAWSYTINDRMQLGGRSGYEYFPKDGNYLYTIAQWFPRMAVYDDVNGWQNKQFLGSGEFALAFGDYTVRITTAADHVVASTGVLQNPKEVLTATQLERFEKAKKSFDKPVIIITQEEAIQNEKSRAKGTKTWVYKAENVRDFAFVSSRKFIWDAQAVKFENNTPLAMSFYPKEGNPLWEKESTKAVVNTLKTYSKYTIDYPYPVAQSIHTASIGMEYPMICFNFGRPNPDGTYSQRTLEGMVGVIVHEVGHNYFPMIINNDERQWAWMDEGINTFLEHQTIVENYSSFDTTWGTPAGVVNYMKGDKNNLRPIMTNPENGRSLGYEAYGKPSAGLVLLRETVMGPELFDAAFKEYAQRWAFKHPSPADFFRTMEDASAVDLDWFWKGWFYSVDACDIAVDKVTWYKMNIDAKGFENQVKVSGDGTLGGGDASVENGLAAPKPFTMANTKSSEYGEFKNAVDDKAIQKRNAEKNFYEVTFKNEGGLMMPIIIEWSYADGTKEVEKIPAEIWRLNEQQVTKVFAKDKQVIGIKLDPKNEIPDIQQSNNVYPRVDSKSRFDKFKDGSK